MRTNIIALDFDGVIMNYAKDGKFSAPIEGAIDAIHWLEEKGYEIVVLTARKDTKEIGEWLYEYGVNVEVTNTKPAALAYVDDRALRFTGHWTDILNYF